MVTSKYFASDNYSGVHPAVMEAIISANANHAPAYGVDEYTGRAIEVMRGEFGPDAGIYFVYNGTGANVLALQSMLRPYQAVICAKTAHVNVDECGAPEKQTGCKLIDIATSDGKLSPELIKPLLNGHGNEHHVQPRVISVSQSTELGTVYTLNELQRLAKFARDNGLYLHVDGARFSNAVVSIDCSLADASINAGVDILSFGGTKNGLMFGEAVVIFNPELEVGFKYLRKQATQLHSKMRFISAQFEVFISKGIWRENALHANKMARYLAGEVSRIQGVTLTREVCANAVFATLPAGWITKLQVKSFFHVWDPLINEVRWMTSFDTTIDDINNFTRFLSEIAMKNPVIG